AVHEEPINAHAGLLSALERRLDDGSTRTYGLVRGHDSLRAVHVVQAQSLGRLEAVSGGQQLVLEARCVLQAELDQRLSSVRKDVRILRERVPVGYLAPIEAEVKELRSATRAAARAAFESAVQLGRDPKMLLSKGQASRLFADYLKREEFLQLRPLI